MIKLSDHFTLEEFTRSAKADELGISNIPNALQISHMQALCDNVLEPLRKHYDKPISIKSGFRCPELNGAVGGASTSQHTKGEAADIEIYGIRNDDIWNFIVSHLNFDQVIAERLSRDDGSAGWIHVSYAVKNRKEALSCPKSGEYVKGLVYGS